MWCDINSVTIYATKQYKDLYNPLRRIGRRGSINRNKYTCILHDKDTNTNDQSVDELKLQ